LYPATNPLLPIKTINTARGVLYFSRYYTRGFALNNFGMKMKSRYSTTSCSISSHWVTGFIDGEGSFTVNIVKFPGYREG